MGGSEGVGASSKQFGVTKPISMAGPTVTDLQRTRELEKVCFIVLFILWYNTPFFFVFLRFVYLFVWKILCFVCKFLAVSGLYESKEEAAKREEVLHRLGEVKGEIERVLFWWFFVVMIVCDAELLYLIVWWQELVWWCQPRSCRGEIWNYVFELIRVFISLTRGLV